MKLACSSTAFDALLRSGELTQLEWIDLCAHELAADGVVFDVRHFPRTDTDYLAQVKKMAVDLGLTVAALRHDGLFDADELHMEQALEIALALGAPLLCAPLPPETAMSWSDVLARLGTATGLAKRFNVTIAVRNVPHTFAATAQDMKRVAKEADSAWLRYGPDFSALDVASDPEALLSKTVLVWHAITVCSAGEVQPIARLLSRYRGFVALDDAQGEARAESANAALDAWRAALQ
jgi:sugar phosphate isomerase/epimerase